MDALTRCLVLAPLLWPRHGARVSFTPAAFGISAVAAAVYVDNDPAPVVEVHVDSLEKALPALDARLCDLARVRALALLRAAGGPTPAEEIEAARAESRAYASALGALAAGVSPDLDGTPLSGCAVDALRRLDAALRSIGDPPGLRELHRAIWRDALSAALAQVVGPAGEVVDRPAREVAEALRMRRAATAAAASFAPVLARLVAEVRAEPRGIGADSLAAAEDVGCTR